MTNGLLNQDELVSALVDGQLRAEEFVQTVAHLESTDDARLTWHTYHVVGEVIRSGEAGASAHDADFVKRLRLRLEDENSFRNFQDASDLIAANASPSSLASRISSRNISANDGAWRLVAGLASLAFVLLIGWQAWTSPGLEGAQVANLQAPNRSPVTPGSAPVMLRDPQLDALLAAHRQFGGTSALQMPSGFLRNATFEEGAR